MKTWEMDVAKVGTEESIMEIQEKRSKSIYEWEYVLWSRVQCSSSDISKNTAVPGKDINHEQKGDLSVVSVTGHSLKIFGQRD